MPCKHTHWLTESARAHNWPARLVRTRSTNQGNATTGDNNNNDGGRRFSLNALSFRPSSPLKKLSDPCRQQSLIAGANRNFWLAARATSSAVAKSRFDCDSECLRRLVRKSREGYSKSATSPNKCGDGARAAHWTQSERVGEQTTFAACEFADCSADAVSSPRSLDWDDESEFGCFCFVFGASIRLRVD